MIYAVKCSVGSPYGGAQPQRGTAEPCATSAAYAFVATSVAHTFAKLGTRSAAYTPSLIKNGKCGGSFLPAPLGFTPASLRAVE